MTNLGKMLKLIRQYKDLTQIEMSNEISINKTSLTHLENGRRGSIGNTTTFLNIINWMTREYDPNIRKS